MDLLSLWLPFQLLNSSDAQCREFTAWAAHISNACHLQLFRSAPGPSLDVRKFLSRSWAVPARLVLEDELLLLNLSQTALQSAV